MFLCACVLPSPSSTGADTRGPWWLRTRVEDGERMSTPVFRQTAADGRDWRRRISGC
jgi:hypothetical protein